MGLLDGKVAIVTGASRGIGAEIARRFGAEGAAVAVVARTKDPGNSPFEGTITETVEQIRAAGGNAVAIEANLARRSPRPSSRSVRPAATRSRSRPTWPGPKIGSNWFPTRSRLWASPTFS
jgi:NAD(P)-dependent dehydrogenase (short-subunit alcohol dehydrogenase family)